MIFEIVISFFCIVFALIIVKIIYKKEFNIRNKKIIFLIMIFCFVFLIRTLGIRYFPKGLNVFLVRLPMAILGCLSLIAMFLIKKKLTFIK